MAAEQEPSAARLARDVAVVEAVKLVVSLAVSGAIVWCLTGGRDKCSQAWIAVKRWRERRDPYAAEIAAFRRDINDISRGTSGPDTSRAMGLYERDAPC